uniref:EGF-like domain-containing protein n=1 Tax=Ditylenchus dipsaci TaxID=166011 RepID=A0A915DP28_9BILA
MSSVAWRRKDVSSRPAFCSLTRSDLDDCTDNPCALGATCHDLINDFECECPMVSVARDAMLKITSVNKSLFEWVMCGLLFDRHCVCKAGGMALSVSRTLMNVPRVHVKMELLAETRKTDICVSVPLVSRSSVPNMVDHCAVSPCRNNATCVNRGPKYECQCRLGFEGVHWNRTVRDLVNDFKCIVDQATLESFAMLISTNASQNRARNATCMDTGSGFQCQCQLGWRGERCSEAESQHCDQRPCQNDGRCVTLVGDYFCVCPEGVNGKNCEIAPNRCIGEPCHNGGVLVILAPGWSAHVLRVIGTGCQYRLDACRSNACKNGATCIQDSETTYKCECLPGFTGSECETNIDECSPSPCSMAATCVDQINAFHCLCPFNMTGANCEKKIDPDYDLHFTMVFSQLELPWLFHSVFCWSFHHRSLVRFDQPHSKGTLFTLYNSRTSNYPLI